MNYWKMVWCNSEGMGALTEISEVRVLARTIMWDNELAAWPDPLHFVPQQQKNAKEMGMEKRESNKSVL